MDLDNPNTFHIVITVGSLVASLIGSFLAVKFALWQEKLADERRRRESATGQDSL